MEASLDVLAEIVEAHPDKMARFAIFVKVHTRVTNRPPPLNQVWAGRQQQNLITLTLSLPRVINFKFPLQPQARNITSQSMENLAFYSLLRRKMILSTKSHYLTYTILFNKLGGCTFWTCEWKGYQEVFSWELSNFFSRELSFVWGSHRVIRVPMSGHPLLPGQPEDGPDPEAVPNAEHVGFSRGRRGRHPGRHAHGGQETALQQHAQVRRDQRNTSAHEGHSLLMGSSHTGPET